MYFCLNNMVSGLQEHNPSHLHSFGGLKGDGCYGKIQNSFSKIVLFKNSDMGKDGLHGVDDILNLLVDSFLIII